MSSARTQSGNVPAEHSPLVGRRAEVAEVKRLLGGARLLTLTGVAGVGKTRLALQVVTTTRRAFPDGVWFVDLTAVSVPELVAHTVVSVLGLDRDSGDTPLSMLIRALRDRHALIALDNCEHVLDVCAELALALLPAAARVQILATSRETLQVRGEHVMLVEPLTLPPPTLADDSPADVLRQYDAVALFEERVGAVMPGFRLSADNVAPAVRLCRRLDGLPLAIELAAARLPGLGLDEVERRLADRFRLLTVQRVAGRHRSLQAAVEWSHDLCTPAERLVWARASVFAGGFDLPAAEYVCAGGPAGDDSVWEAVADLVTKSILVLDQASGECPYRLLDTLRAYGWERLREAGEESAAARRHRDWYLQLAERFAAESSGTRQMDALAAMQVHHPNLRAALEFCATEPGEGETGLRMMSALWFYWTGRSIPAEARHWFGRLLPAAPDASVDRIEALWWVSYFDLIAADLPELRRHAEECDALARQHPDADVCGLGLFAMGYVALLEADHAAAEQRFTEGVARMRHGGGGRHPAMRFAYATGAFAAAAGGHYAAAEHWVDQARALAAETGERYMYYYAVWSLAVTKLDAGLPEEAVLHARECLRLERGIQDMRALINLQLLSRASAAGGRYEYAAVLIGIVDHLERELGISVLDIPGIAEPWAASRHQIRRALGRLAFDAALARGSALDIEHAVALALDEPAPEHSRAGRANGPQESPLTPREREVAELIGAGLSNKEIARRLVIAPRTAESHVENILVKLGFTSRAQIAARMSRE